MCCDMCVPARECLCVRVSVCVRVYVCVYVSMRTCAKESGLFSIKIFQGIRVIRTCTLF